RTLLDATLHGRSEFGQVVVARDFGEALEARLAELPRLLRYRPARFITLDTPTEDGLRRLRVATPAGKRILRTRLLVAADGTRSAVRDALGIGAQEHDYAQTLFVTRLRTERAPDGTAYERLGDTGPTALLPRGDRHYGLVHAVARAQADAVVALDEADFLALTQDAFGWRVGRFLACGPRAAYPAVRVLAETITAPRAVLIGNAAQTIHPLGAQGFNLGLRDALTLAELIDDGARAQASFDCGAPDLLNAHARRRREDREQTVALSDGLTRITSSPTSLLRPLRSLGLLALDRSPSAQAALIGGALGYRGEVPRLCRRSP
ncbi:MAG: FAD-dependent monooxygenase, partial [Pseudomonadota bacterium]|nr:FAD-dependent monooxygenase [Pseudomonadota bacterium]